MNFIPVQQYQLLPHNLQVFPTILTKNQPNPHQKHTLQAYTLQTSTTHYGISEYQSIWVWWKSLHALYGASSRQYQQLKQVSLSIYIEICICKQVLYVSVLLGNSINKSVRTMGIEKNQWVKQQRRSRPRNHICEKWQKPRPRNPKIK